MKLAALLPVRDFASAKRRLRPALSDVECAGLAEAMLADVMAAVDAAGSVRTGFLLGGADARRVAAAAGWEWLDDEGGRDLAAIVDRAAATLARRGCHDLLVLHGDLPGIDATAIDQLAAAHHGGLTLCPARRDGGTNALIVTPPDAIRFQYGPDSACRHLQAGMAAGLATRRVRLPACESDIDTPADLVALAAGEPGGRTGAWLAASGVAARLARPRAAGQDG